jgi:hypothetical protein
MVVEFTTTCAITIKVVSSNPLGFAKQTCRSMILKKIGFGETVVAHQRYYASFA